MLRNYIDSGVGYEDKWTFFQNSPGTTPDGCKDKPVSEEGVSGSPKIDEPPFPQGEWTVKLYDQDCKYGSDGNGAGTLTCPNHDPISCKEHGDRGGGRDKTQDCGGWEWKYTFHASVYCEW